MFRNITIFLIANYYLLAGGNAQFSSNNSSSSSPGCSNAQTPEAKDLYGKWTLVLTEVAPNDRSQTTELVFKRNPEFEDSLAGDFKLQGESLEVFGDIEAGVLDLEESGNGKDIQALWKGRVVVSSCGQAITGTRRLTSTQAEQNFVLRRAGW